jgi:hypothetical protein
VILKFLAKIDVETDTVMDGVQCTDIVFAKPPGHYSIILVSTLAAHFTPRLTNYLVRFTHAEQRWLPSMQRNQTMGKETRIPTFTHHCPFRQRSRRRLREMRGSRLQLVRDEASRVQTTFTRHDEVPGPCGSLKTS